MEPTAIFAASVGIIGFFHLASNVVKTFTKGARKRHSASAPRNDWYCFFNMSDLVGKDWRHQENKGEDIQVTRDAGVDEQRRRQQALRPRIQA
jgi:hypothetical protein